MFTTKKPTRVAVLDVGYYHGFCVEKARILPLYRRRDRLPVPYQKTLLGQKIYVTVNGRKARVLGHVGMLHTVIDVTDIECGVGDIARLEVNPLMAKGIRRVYR